PRGDTRRGRPPEAGVGGRPPPAPGKTPKTPGLYPPLSVGDAARAAEKPDRNRARQGGAADGQRTQYGGPSAAVPDSRHRAQNGLVATVAAQPRPSLDAPGADRAGERNRQGEQGQRIPGISGPVAIFIIHVLNDENQQDSFAWLGWAL